MTILVTGGAGYIGSHTYVALLEAGRGAEAQGPNRLARGRHFMAVAAAEEEAGDQTRERFLVKTRDPARDSALRAHAMRRSQVHFKCDNSAKV